MTDLDLAIVVPVFNQPEGLPRLHEELTAALAKAGLCFEVPCVDDGSTDPHRPPS